MSLEVTTRIAADPDQSVIEAFEEFPHKPVRIRIQPMVSRQPDGGRFTYLAWKHLHWLLSVDTLDDARAVREALTLFFALLAKHGAKHVTELLSRPATA